MTLTLLDAGVALFCFSAFAFLYHYFGQSLEQNGPPLSQARGYILENQVTHVRLLPAESGHSFTYPTISLLVSLDALETHQLDLGRGLVFGYGSIWGCLVGLRAAPYLAGSNVGAGESTIRRKLEDMLRARGFGSMERLIDDAWMMTMPNFLGFEGINPLTLYFCYKSEALWLAVFEIHNTFGETHVHILEVGRNEDAPTDRPKGFDHQWTFPREFHVSPFNDRSGFYTVSIKSPTHPPTPTSACCKPPRPAVRVHLHTSAPLNAAIPGPLKLTALLRPVASHPLTTPNLLGALARAPFALLLSFPRIASEAWTLHYRRRLDVFLRPEPLPPGKSSFSWAGMRRGGGVKWLKESTLERYARGRLEAFLRQRVECGDLNFQVSLVAADPAIPDLIFHPRIAPTSSPTAPLVICYLSPRFFTLLFACPSPEHALLLGSDTEGVFSVSSRDLFLSALSSVSFSSLSSDAPGEQDSMQRKAPRQRLRTRPVPASIALHIPATHPLDPAVSSPIFERMKATLVLHILFLIEHLERLIFSVARARVVPGQEPWMQWERASRVFDGKGEAEAELRERSGCGSVRREE